MDRQPPKRQPNQVFVLHNHEPPYINKYFDPYWKNGFKQTAWKSVFNWTMTYRTDSDIPALYGLLRKRPTPLVDKDYKKIVAQKSKMAAWMVSNCDAHSMRNEYVQELSKYIQVDVYGKCGPNKCTHFDNNSCMEEMSKKYYFYLSFESAICPDYFTEKFYLYYNMDTVLVARASDDLFQFAPRDVYLNTASFPSPKQLAEKMLALSNNDEAYIEMLKRKDEYVAIMESQLVRDQSTGYIKVITYHYEYLSICQMCQRLWNLDRYAKTYADIHTWFDRKICKKPTDLNFLKRK